MNIPLTRQEVDLILGSLAYTKRAFAEYTGYPSYEYKQQRIREVDDIVAKIRAAKREAAEETVCA